MNPGPARDDTGRPVRLPGPPARVVSLVPSLTETIAASAPELLVGVTAWCTHPPGLPAERVGGTKNPDVERIAALAPDLVLANAEENREVDLAALRGRGLPVWVTAPTTVPGALDSLTRLLAACGLGTPGWLGTARRAWAAPHAGPVRTALIPVWRRPWMALGRDTFAGDVLSRLGVRNVLARHPDRYPRIEPARLDGYRIVVLPDEPYPFSPQDGPESFPGIPAFCVSGRHLTWYGPSLAEARELLEAQLREPAAGQL